MDLAKIKETDNYTVSASGVGDSHSHTVLGEGCISVSFRGQFGKSNQKFTCTFP